jgi:caffeoyl-CoA O-methyltransferase
MSNRSIGLSASLHRYLLDVSLREPDLMQRLREETAQHPESDMQIAPEQGQFMQLLVRLMGAQKTLEIGTFTGYSALAVALTLPDDGQLVACDVSEDYTRIARRYWAEAGVDHKIDLRIAPAVETLDALLDDGHAGTFDFAFIDADKTSYDTYYERALHLVRPGGLIVLDNVLRHGRVVDPAPDDASTQAIARLNDKLHDDERIHLSLIPVADGLTLALKKESEALP